MIIARMSQIATTLGKLATNERVTAWFIHLHTKTKRSTIHIYEKKQLGMQQRELQSGRFIKTHKTKKLHID
jgi:hypothetical protein